jgi:hypothetical protein
LGATAGTLTATKPFAPNHLVYIGIVERANAGQGQIYVKPQNGYEMNELHDVQSNGAINNDILYRDTTVTPNLWKPASIPTILGYTPQAQLNGTGFVVASGTTISYDNTTYTPTSRILTINGTSFDLSADRSWTVTAGVGDLPEISVNTANAREDNYAPVGWPGVSNIVKVIRINSTNTNYMMSLGGLASPSAGRIVTIYNNSSANNLIIIENLSTSSTAANRFRMTGNMPYFLLPNRSVTFIYDGTFWTQMSASNIGGFDLFDDATGAGTGPIAVGSAGLFGVHSVGAGAGIGASPLVSNEGFGEYALLPGTTTTGYTSLTTMARRTGGNNAFGAYAPTASMPYLFVGKVGLSALATVALDYRFFFGMNGVGALVGNAFGQGYVWAYSGNAATNWDVRSQNAAGTTSVITTTVPITANTYLWLGVYKPGGANIRDAVYFYSNNGIIYTAEYKFVGTASSYGGQPTVLMGAIAGTAASRASYVDWLGTSFNLPR